MKESPLETSLSLKFIREHIIGRDFSFQTPYGDRLLTYADYTASGRCLTFIEKYLIHIQRSYANTHTEDDISGRTMTGILHNAEHIIKRAFHAEKNYCIIATGTGSTGAISKFQEIIGLRLPAATKLIISEILSHSSDKAKGNEDLNNLTEYFHKRRPVVFVGPYEHHSNDIMWRESIAEVVLINMTSEGTIDLHDLVQKISNPYYKGRFKIGSFSAASNVTGIKTPVYDVARILHKYGCLACFDFAASAPYVKIDMHRDKESYFDAIFISPHKFLGGPGSTGILVFNEALYHRQLPPTFAAGGTVDYVSPFGVDYSKDIETREKPGTPGIIQTIKAALAIDLKDRIGLSVIEDKELDYNRRAFALLQNHPNIEILGNPDPEKRISVFSFVIKHGGKYLHPKLGTKLLNDLFGIQSRAGCSCAGVYGHFLLKITPQKSAIIRDIVNQGIFSIKPGWIRVNFHYSFSETEFQFICKAIKFIADYGYRFIPEYVINLKTGDWHHKEFEDIDIKFNPTIENVLKLSMSDCFDLQEFNQAELYQSYLEVAENLVENLPQNVTYAEYHNELAEKIRWFNFLNTCE